MNGLVLYKLAGTEEVRMVSGRIVPYSDQKRGFLISTFRNERYIIMDEEAETTSLWVSEHDIPRGEEEMSEKGMRERYGERFRMFHRKLTSGELRKVVLSRRRWCGERIDMHETAKKAFEMYKSQTVVMISSEITGTWLIVTPELLVEMRGGTGRTIALAGTMKSGEGEWSEKNREEQRLVAEYIGESIRPCCEMLEEDRPRTVKAGELLHLCSDFRFRTKERWITLVERLFPTPAVCGLGKDEARRMITDNEGYDRELYSGYLGNVMDDNCQLFVTLRCMKLAKEGYWLYAGGGLLAESDEEREWQETENKMETIRRCIVKKQA